MLSLRTSQSPAGLLGENGDNPGLGAGNTWSSQGDAPAAEQSQKERQNFQK
jgi:hypothetical protein